MFFLGLVRFLPFDNVQAWKDAMFSLEEIEKPGHSLIIDKFNESGFNSEAMVSSIEEQYIEMKSGRKNGN